MKTAIINKHQMPQKKWYLIDANGKTLGRLAVKIANILRGRNHPLYTPHCDTGDYVVVVNAAKIHVTGNKETDKTYANYSGYQSGLHITALKDLRAKHPDRILFNAVRGMLPKNNLARHMLKKLRIYADEQHSNSAQSLISVEE